MHFFKKITEQMINNQPATICHLFGRNVSAKVKEYLQHISARQTAATFDQVHNNVQ